MLAPGNKHHRLWGSQFSLSLVSPNICFPHWKMQYSAFPALQNLCVLPSASAAICSPELAAAGDCTCPFRWLRHSKRKIIYPNTRVAFLWRSRGEGGGLLVLAYFYGCLALAAFEGSPPAIWLSCVLCGKGLVAETAGAAHAGLFLVFSYWHIFYFKFNSSSFFQCISKILWHPAM